MKWGPQMVKWTASERTAEQRAGTKSPALSGSSGPIVLTSQTLLCHHPESDMDPEEKDLLPRGRVESGSNIQPKGSKPQTWSEQKQNSASPEASFSVLKQRKDIPNHLKLETIINAQLVKTRKQQRADNRQIVHPEKICTKSQSSVWYTNFKGNE